MKHIVDVLIPEVIREKINPDRKINKNDSKGKSLGDS